MTIGTIRTRVARQLARTTLTEYVRVQGTATAQRLMLPWTMRRLRSARSAGHAVTDPTSRVYVSLTTYGARLHLVHWAIESIARGSVRPGRIVLWLDDEAAFDSPPAALADLVARGLEIRLSENYGPHTKAYPAIAEGVPDDWVFVTADDDTIYPRWWLRRLVGAALRDRESIVCLRALAYAMEPGANGGALAVMDRWRWVRDSTATSAHFGLGVSGLVYPLRLRRVLAARGTEFLRCAPRADDVWINAVAAENGIGVRQVGRVRAMFPTTPGGDDGGLTATNVHGGQNDVQVRATYGPAHLAGIQRAVGDCRC